MDDLISRQAAINLLMKRADELRGITGDLGGACAGAARLIERLPPAKTGKWIAKSEHYRWMRKCSVCGWMQEIDTPKMQGWYYSYCPNCGADMRGEEER